MARTKKQILAAARQKRATERAKQSGYGWCCVRVRESDSKAIRELAAKLNTAHKQETPT